MSEITVARTTWGHAAGVHCPHCAAQTVWIEKTHHYHEDNAGDCHICVICGHSFHYVQYEGEYIDAGTTAEILAAVRAL